MARMNWKGDEVAAKYTVAARLGVDQTTGEAVNHAKQNHPGWANVTGTLEGSIQMRPAEDRGGEVVGQWGSFDTAYALWQEIGTANMPAHPYLRPAADVTYPRLSAKIRAARAAMP